MAKFSAETRVPGPTEFAPQATTLDKYATCKRPIISPINAPTKRKSVIGISPRFVPTALHVVSSSIHRLIYLPSIRLGAAME